MKRLLEINVGSAKKCKKRSTNLRVELVMERKCVSASVICKWQLGLIGSAANLSLIGIFTASRNRLFISSLTKNPFPINSKRGGGGGGCFICHKITHTCFISHCCNETTRIISYSAVIDFVCRRENCFLPVNKSKLGTDYHIL